MPEKITDCVLDIETVPEPTSAVVEALVEQIRAPANYKDPQKIAAHREAAKAKIIADAALRASTARIVVVSIGIRLDDGWDFGAFVDRAGDEKQMLSRVQAALEHYQIGALGTFNGRNFDIPFITARSMVHGLRLHTLFPQEFSRHIDLFHVLGKHGGLDEWSRAILGEGKTGTGSQVAELVASEAWEQLEAYALDDVRLTAALLDRYLGRGIK